MPPDLQQRLLSLIQSGTYTPLGGAEEQQVDLQVIPATNEDLREAIRGRRFREDLYWRLAEITVQLPPLNGRPADILPLAQSLLERARIRYARPELAGLSPAAATALLRADWSAAGNIRGLEQTINRSVLLAPAELTTLEAGHLQLEAPLAPGREQAAGGLEPTPRPRRPLRTLDPARREALRTLLEGKIAAAQGSVAAMAQDAELAAALG